MKQCTRKIIIRATMSTDIQPISPLEDDIVDAVNRSILVVFIGADVSQIVGILGWDQLAKNLVETCATVKLKDDQPQIKFKAVETLSLASIV